MASRGIIPLLLIGIGISLLQAPVGFAEGTTPVEAPQLDSEAAVLIDADSGVVLYGKNPELQMYPASITKIVTAIIAIEEANLNDIVTVSKEARNEEGTRVYLAEGEQVTLEKLVYGMLINSGNDAATAIAEHIDGSKEAFAERMNRFVEEIIGVENTRFTNPSGLPDPEMMTTAEDMAAITRYAMQNEIFRTIVSTKTMPWIGEEWETELINHNRMLWDYEGATGVKNGYTTAAGNTLVTSATRAGIDLIVVVLKAPGSKQAYADTAALLDYGFDGYYMKTLFQAGETYVSEDENATVEWKADEAIHALVPNGTDPVSAVNSEGEVVVDTPYGEQVAGSLTVSSRVDKMVPEEPKTAIEKISREESAEKGSGISGLVAASIGLLLTGAWIRKRRIIRRNRGGYRRDRFE
ncbi:D-alanyl-D-alanine carboxypeptidase family protein [Cohnella thailandensis]|uniref:D-alanyl-D-alanine carboxypeptidase n=1 Tax=Cohnella thailandensis TaxID=557557 RepID=A0A841T3K1_9BACL|nr:D-alanyl-D-alanine carboxypeptidase family protein [Cohnella thailandensis]MBB6636938.1 D-alanyl-D-alanine carboxypeptidase [Cohnella thailandensis]MBP1973180.1 D-alanyl-D-alanine carboxypeptidase [Cohnella thailandensis]